MRPRRPTRFLRARGWRLPLLAAGAVALAAIVALVVAFAVLTRNDNRLPPATTPVVAPAPPAP